MDREKIEEIVLKEKEGVLKMSRVPLKTKKLFLAIAEEDFCGDYGMTLKSILDGYMQFKIFFENVDMKLDKILFGLSQNKKKEDTPETSTKMMSGRRVERGDKA